MSIRTLPASLVESAREVLNDYFAGKNREKWFGKSVLVDHEGNPRKLYHGSPADFSAFSSKYIGRGNDTLGSGHYFTTDPEQASSYTGNNKVHTDASNDGGNIKQVFLRMQKPIYTHSDTPFTQRHILGILYRSPNFDDAISNFGYDGRADSKIRAVDKAVSSYSEFPKIDAFYAMQRDFMFGDSGEEIDHYHKAVTAATGHDGVIDFRFPDKTNLKKDHYVAVAWHPNTIKSAFANNGEYSKKSDDINESLC